VLSPEQFCGNENIRGAKMCGTYAEFLLKLEDPTFKEQFERHQQFANFFTSQIQLFAHMNIGRSYNAIAWLERAFPYVSLVSMCSNVLLPGSVRATACEFVRSLYIDR
jgi:hypothetical protein